MTSFFELVLRILRTLDATYPQFDIAKRTEPLYELKLEDAAKQAEALLLDVLTDKCLVVLMENLDDLFVQIGEQGQKAWRAFMQNHTNMVLVCTTPSLFAGVSVHKSAFYGFFDIEPLVELEFEDVASLLRKIAVERGDSELAAFIDTPEGRARIRAVHHLAEGNPRIYIIFAQFLSHEALDELVQAFMHTLDELTPYYQARMKELPGQQRKIVEYLLHYRGAAAVKAIAKACFVTQQVCSSQLKQLKDKRYVRSIEQGRESYYELSEPMMRLCMEVKKQMGEPIGLVVDILRIWYTESELNSWLEQTDAERKFDIRYVIKALEKIQKQVFEPKLLAQIQELRKCAENNKPTQLLSLLDEVASTRPANKHSAHIRSIVLLTCANRPELQSKLRPELDVLTDAFESGLNIWKEALTRTDALTIYSTILRASIGLYRMDEGLGTKSLPNITELLAKFPAQAIIATMRCASKADSVIYQKWLGALFRHVPDISATQNQKRNFLRVARRMTAAFVKWSDAEENKPLLELPKEERTLLVSFIEKLKSKI